MVSPCLEPELWTKVGAKSLLPVDLWVDVGSNQARTKSRETGLQPTSLTDVLYAAQVSMSSIGRCDRGFEKERDHHDGSEPAAAEPKQR